MGIAIQDRTARGSKPAARSRRHLRVRKKVSGTTQRPRLVVTRSLRHIVAQVVDDTVGHTLVSASTMEVDLARRRTKPAKSESSLPRARRPLASTVSCSTELATDITDESLQWQMARETAGSPCDNNTN